MRTGATLGLALALATCAGEGRLDAAGAVAREFCRVYVEDANPLAALALTAEEAHRQVQQEVWLLGGQRPAHPPSSLARLVAHETFESGALIRYHVRIRIPPHPGARRGTLAEQIPMDLFLRRISPQGGWRVVAFRWRQRG